MEPSQYLLMQLMQKLWPHGVDEGLVNMSRQIEHRNCSSDRKLPDRDILWRDAEVNQQDLHLQKPGELSYYKIILLSDRKRKGRL